MPDVLILADPPAFGTSPQAASPAWEMKRAIGEHFQAKLPDSPLPSPRTAQSVEIVWTTELATQVEYRSTQENLLLCPLTFNVPDAWATPGREVFAACRDTATMRQTVARWQYPVGDGPYWLPLVLTAKGLLFAEAIAQIEGKDDTFHQPFHLDDAQRQPLYKLGQDLMRSLAALPGVYLMQFGIDDEAIQFDRLIPFPDKPAIASVGRQTPDLFLCHWYCLTHQPIRELSITPYAA
ncbi:MAG: hypothetical protein NW220_11085 [Leptolyngbyaceae cyanobacterium bins.349]|nr:hypothetical protein [Leptolyngbyaceae cyanobacterium bins.349]